MYSKHDFLGISHRKPSTALIEALKAVCADPANVVVVITALPRQVLLAQLNAVPEMVLAAENGRFVAIPPSKEGYSKAFQTIIKTDRRNAASSVSGGAVAMSSKSKTKAQRTAAAMEARVDEEELGSDDGGGDDDAELLPTGAWTPPAPASPITPAPGTRKTLRKPKPPPPPPLPAAAKAINAQGSLTGKGLEEGVRVTSWRMSRLLKATSMSKAAAERLWVRNEANDVAVDAEGSVIEPQWKKMSTDLMRKYAMVVSGSTIEDNGMQVEFSFKNADPEWGYEQARFLTDELSDALQHFPVTVSLCRSGNVSVTPRGAGKGRMMCQLLKTFERLHDAPPDFILAVGDEGACSLCLLFFFLTSCLFCRFPPPCDTNRRSCIVQTTLPPSTPPPCR